MYEYNRINDEVNAMLDSITGYDPAVKNRLKEMREELKRLRFNAPFRHLMKTLKGLDELSVEDLRDVKRQIRLIIEELMWRKRTWNRLSIALASQEIAEVWNKHGHPALPHLPYDGNWFLYLLRGGKDALVQYKRLLKVVNASYEEKLTKSGIKKRFFVKSPFVKKAVLVASALCAAEKKKDALTGIEFAFINPIKYAIENEKVLFPQQDIEIMKNLVEIWERKNANGNY